MIPRSACSGGEFDRCFEISAVVNLCSVIYSDKHSNEVGGDETHHSKGKNQQITPIRAEVRPPEYQHSRINENSVKRRGLIQAAPKKLLVTPYRQSAKVCCVQKKRAI